MKSIILLSNRNVVEGLKAIDLEAGELVQVISNGTNLGDILIRTTSYEHPFVDIKNGRLWGNVLENYKFAILPPTVILLNHEYEQPD